MMKRVLVIAVVAVCFVLVLGGSAWAQSPATSNLGVSASVAASCRILSVSNIAFGAYDPTSPTNLDAAGSMQFRCVKQTAYKAFIAGTRTMAGSGSDTISFQLYSDSGRTAAFPSDHSGSAVTATSNAAVDTSIYGRVPAQQDVGVDSYSTTLTATVEY